MITTSFPWLDAGVLLLVLVLVLYIWFVTNLLILNYALYHSRRIHSTCTHQHRSTNICSDKDIGYMSQDEADIDNVSSTPIRPNGIWTERSRQTEAETYQLE